MKSSAIDVVQWFREALMRLVGGDHGKYCVFFFLQGSTLYAVQCVANYLWSFWENNEDALSPGLIMDPMPVMITKAKPRGGLICKISVVVISRWHIERLYPVEGAWSDTVNLLLSYRRKNKELVQIRSSLLHLSCLILEKLQEMMRKDIFISALKSSDKKLGLFVWDSF